MRAPRLGHAAAAALAAALALALAAGVARPAGAAPSAGSGVAAPAAPAAKSVSSWDQAYAAAPTAPEYDALGRLTDTPLAPVGSRARLTNDEAVAKMETYPKVAAWLKRYPAKGRQVEATWDKATDVWTVNMWWGKAGEIVTGKIADDTGTVTEAWTGPQVAWTMARGYVGSFGGDLVNDLWVWVGLGVAFLLGLADLRRPLALRNLDVLVLLSLLVSLRLFNEGDVFGAMPAAAGSLAWLLARLVWVGSGRRLEPPRWAQLRLPAPRVQLRGRLGRHLAATVLIAATVFTFGLRVGLNAADSNVIDVGYAGVIGAQRIAHGQAPWGNFPVEDSRPACGPADSAGQTRDRIQTNGRCESSNPRGDTYGPTAYLAYLPGYGVEGWNGKWDTGRGWGQVPAVHLTSVISDALAVLGLFLVGLRFGGARLGGMLAFAWAAYPLTLYAYMSNTNDSIAPVLLILGFWVVTSPWLRGAAVAAAGWSKLAGLVLAPLWAAYPESLWRRSVPEGEPGGPRPGGFRGGRVAWRFAAGFVLATLMLFSILLLEPSPAHELRVFVERTFSWQLGRHSPFSLWDWGQYHAKGVPSLKAVQHLLQVLLVVGALAAAIFPRGRRSPRQLAALSGALLIGFELVLTHWSWLYVPWFFPFAAIALLAPAAALAAPVARTAAAAPAGAVAAVCRREVTRDEI